MSDIEHVRRSGLPVPAAEVSRIYAILQQQYGDMRNKTEDAEPFMRSEEEFALFLHQLLGSIHAEKGAGSASEHAGSDNRRAYSDRIMQWIERNYHKPIRLEHLSEAMHLSPYHLSRLFADETGHTFKQYLTSIRIRETCLLLASTSLSLKEISRKAGFSGTSYLCQVFKKHLGLSPYKYRTLCNSTNYLNDRTTKLNDAAGIIDSEKRGGLR